MISRLWRSKRARWATAGGVVVVAAGLTIGLVLAGSSGAAVPAGRTLTVSTGTIRQAVLATGTLQPSAEADLTFAVSGQVSQVSAAVGQTVTAGQVLATLDPTALAASLAAAQATVASDQAKVSNDTATGAPAAQLAADQAALTAAQGQANAAQNAMSETSLTTPISGVVAAVNLVAGQSVGAAGGGSSVTSGAAGSAAGGGSAAGSKAATATSSGSEDILVINTSGWLVAASVDDTQVGLIATGDQAVVNPAGAGVVYGTVSSIGLMASSTGGVATFPVTINITGSPSGMHAGATAQVSIVYKQLSNVVTVPLAAVHVSGGRTVVDEPSAHGPVTHPVTEGAASGGQVQITAGLSAGDKILLPAAAGKTASPAGGRRTGTGKGPKTGAGKGAGKGGAAQPAPGKTGP